ncbi:MAG: hypothetical protein K2G84_09490 [Muribaculaceae bacterium]|nr:hypothetical protein [Muribaculaceae bacterium]
MKLLKHIIAGVILLCPAIATAQNTDGGEAPLSLNVYIPDNAGIPENAARNLEAKLSHAIAANGFGSQSFDNRFVIVPRAEVNSVTVTPTAPPKTVVEGTLYLYVGDGVTSTLFASEAFPVKGIGSNESKAFLSAFTKINARDRRLQEMLETGRQRIREYYEQQWPSMVKSAEAAYGEGNYENALSILYSIPPTCTGYNQAMDLATRYAAGYRDNSNASLLTQARAAWSQAPNEQGAAEAMKIIAQIDPASSSASGATALCNEIKTRLKQVDDREWQEAVAAEKAARELAAKREANASAERRAAIKAAGEVARAYASRPVYRIGWW